MALISSFEEVNLDALDATITDNAVDIFVYDTRKDSDGGKWRKRTKKTSWYNETLNTSTRGSDESFLVPDWKVDSSTSTTNPVLCTTSDSWLKFFEEWDNTCMNNFSPSDFAVDATDSACIDTDSRP